MLKIARYYTRLAKDERGATAIEYSLIATILGVALIPVLMHTSSAIFSVYTLVQGFFDLV